MEITKSHIENVRRAAKAKGLNSTSDDIREAIAQFYNNDDALAPSVGVGALVLSEAEVASPRVGEFSTADIPAIVDILLAQQPAQPLGIPTSSIIVAEEEKHELVADAAQQIGVSLVASEIKQIAQNIASGFDSREQLFNEVANAIVAFAEYRIGAQSSRLRDAAERIRTMLGDGNNTTKDVFSNIRNDITSTNDDFKSHIEGITAFFAVPS